MQKQLLPVGFYDLLFDEAKQSHININKTLELFFAANYNLVKLPLIEFEDSFAAEKVKNSFRTIDVISGKNLIFRNDITLQLSRVLNNRLSEIKTPLKLCYVGDVLCAKSQDLYADRQQTQLGIEIIGCDNQKSACEIIEISLKALNGMGLNGLLIEFSLPNFLPNFLAEIDKNIVEKKDELRDAIMKKNLSEIKNLAGKYSAIINKIVTSNHDLGGLTKEILQIIKSEKITEILEKAREISEFLAKKNHQISFCFDLFGDCESSYHSNLSFDVFCGDFSYPIARGGSYEINSQKAVGATIYMNRLRKIQ